jgi:hypothetical protein
MSVAQQPATGFRGKHAMRRRPADAEAIRTLLECAPSGINAALAARIMDLDESRLMAMLRSLSLDGHAVEIAPGRWSAHLAPASSGG